MFELTRSTLTIFGFSIHWYGVLIALGVLGAVLLAWRREERLGLKKETTLDLALICVPVGILCARLYYVLFSWDYYAAHPAKILDLRGGGLAIYGGVIGGVLAGWIYSRVKKVSFGTLADLVAPGLAFGQAVGRWGNFLNQEAYGAAVTNAKMQFFPLSIYIEGSGWHWATFFYESLWCALICIFLLIAERRGFFRRKGDTFLWYLFLYALERCLVEGLRTDSLYIGPLRVSQLLSLTVLLILQIGLCLRLRGRQSAALSLYQVACVVLLGAFVCAEWPVSALIWALIVLLNAAMGYGVTYQKITTDEESA